MLHSRKACLWEDETVWTNGEATDDGPSLLHPGLLAED
jgi:hypothetical protein